MIRSNSIRALNLSAILALGVPLTAFAAEPFPVMSQGESFSVDYSNDRNNIVGDGFATATGGEDVHISYANPNIGNRAAGIPVFVGGSEGDVAYIVMPNSNTLASR
jgi:hypothetical protein